jgi:hypothetical protein
MKKLDDWQDNKIRSHLNCKVPEGESTETLIHSKNFVFGVGLKVDTLKWQRRHGFAWPTRLRR